MSTPEIIDRWRAGETIAVIAEAAGCSKQAISRRLIRAGFSPRERQYAEAAANGSQASADRLDVLTERAEQREQAAARLQALAAEVGMSPRALLGVAKEGGTTPGLLARLEAECAPYSPDYLCHVIPSG